MARILIVIAAVLWSTSSVFTRVLQKPTFLGLESPSLTPLQIAFYRSFFAGIVLMALIRPRHATYRPQMLWMILSFGIMTALYLSALALGSAANAILLQNTAPVWVYFLGVSFLGAAPDRRTLITLLMAMAGAMVIVVGNIVTDPNGGQRGNLLMAAGSGFFFAVVVLMLGVLKRESSIWLCVLNLLGGAAVIAFFGMMEAGIAHFPRWLAQPTPKQMLFIAFFGTVQLAIPYILFTFGLKSISPQEAGIITLLEPLLNPIWAYLFAPETDTPSISTLIGGTILLTALIWRFR